MAENGPSIFTYERCRDHFDTEDAAANYPCTYTTSFRHQREKAVLTSLIQQLPSNSHVLALPCGTGREAILLHEHGHRTTAADASSHMVDYTKQNTTDIAAAGRIEYAVREAAHTGYPDKSFDAVICNRLFHHFSEPETRIAVLKEFVRLTDGPVIVSFKSSTSVSWQMKRFSKWIRGHDIGTGRSITVSTFRSEFMEAGLSVGSLKPIIPGISRMWYACGHPQTSSSLKAA